MIKNKTDGKYVAGYYIMLEVTYKTINTLGFVGEKL